MHCAELYVQCLQRAELAANALLRQSAELGVVLIRCARPCKLEETAPAAKRSRLMNMYLYGPATTAC